MLQLHLCLPLGLSVCSLPPPQALRAQERGSVTPKVAPLVAPKRSQGAKTSLVTMVCDPLHSKKEPQHKNRHTVSISMALIFHRDKVVVIGENKCLKSLLAGKRCIYFLGCHNKATLNN